MATFDELKEKLGWLEQLDPTPRTLEERLAALAIGPPAPAIKALKAVADKVGISKQDVAQGAGGLLTEVGIGEAGRYGGAALGALGGPAAPITVPAGYVIGGFGSGYVGNVANQKIRSPEKDISQGEAIAAGLVNLIPFGKLGKIGTSSLKGSVAAGAAVGAGVGAITETTESLVNEKELPTLKELMGTTVSSSLFGGALGFSPKVFEKVLGMNPSQIDKAILNGDKDVVEVVNKFQDQFGVKTKPTMDQVWKYLVPSKLIGKKALGEIKNYRGTQAQARTTSGYLSKRAENFINETTNPTETRQLVDSYIAGEIKELPQGMEKIQKTVEESRTMILDLQERELQLHYDKEITLPDDILKSVEASVASRDYFTRQYDIHQRPQDWAKLQKEKPHLKAEALEEIQGQVHPDSLDKRPTITKGGVEVDNPNYGKLKKTLKRPVNYTKDEAQQVLDDIQVSANTDAQKQFGSLAGIFKERKNITPAVRKWMGEIENVEEKMALTQRNLARTVAVGEADAGLKNLLLESGLAKKQEDVLGVTNEVKLQLRGQGYEDILVKPEIQDALNQLYVQDPAARTSWLTFAGLDELARTGVSLSKAAKVIGNIPAYGAQVWALGGNLGSNGYLPFHKESRKMFKDATEMVAADTGYMNKRVFKELSDLPQKIGQYAKYGLIDGVDAMQDILQGIPKNKVGATLDKFLRPVGKAYAFADNTGRLFYQQGLEKTMQKIVPEIEGEDLVKLAAHFNRKTYTNYPETGHILKEASFRGLLGPFSTFSFDLARTQWGQLQTIEMMLKSPQKFADETRRVLGRDVSISSGELQKEGRKRLLSYMSVMAAGGFGVSTFNEILGGVNREEENAIRQTILPEWAENQNLLLTKKGDKLQYANASYMLPQAQMLQHFKAFQRGEDFWDSVSNTAKSLYGEYGGEGNFILQNIIGAASNVDLQTRKKISTSSNALRSFLDRSDFFLKKSFTPQEVREVQKALRGQPVGQTLLRHIGVRINPVEVDKGLKFTVKDLQDRLRQVGSSQATAKYMGDQERFMKLESDRQGIFKEVQQHVRNLNTLGYEEDEVVEKFNKAGLGRSMIFQAIDNAYEPKEFENLSQVREAMSKVEVLKGDERVRFIEQLDPTTKREVMESLQREAKHPSWTERDKYINSMGVRNGERAGYLFTRFAQNPQAAQELKRMKARGVINDDVLKQILQLQS